VEAGWGLLGVWWIAVFAGAALAGAVFVKRPRAATIVAMLLIVAGGATAGVAVSRGGIGWFADWLNMIARPMVLGPIVALTLAACWFYAGAGVRPRNARTGALVAVVAAVMVLCWGAWAGWSWAYARSPKGKLDWQSIWQTRYLAFVWPALAVAAAALLMRIPLWPLRWLGVLALIVPNIANIIARNGPAGHEGEVPYNRMIADVWRARDRSTGTRVVLAARELMANDATVSDRNPGWVYYACLEAQHKPSPAEFNGGAFWHDFKRQVGLTARRDVRVVPDSGARDVVVWEGPSREPGGVPEDKDPTLRTLGRGWRRVEEQGFRHRGMTFWSWMEREWYYRRRYVKG
jgi:hypothetical protein